MASRRRRRTGPPPRPAAKPHRPRRTTGPATRAQQQAAAAQRRRQARLRKVVLALLLLAAVGAVAAYVASSRSADASQRETLTAGSCEVDTASDQVSGGDGHVAAPRYSVDPPAGGDHLASVARGGVHDVDVAQRASMATPVAATAWGQRLRCGEVEPDVLDRFAEEHVGYGPEDVERG